jgi:pimeloyl-ACP methyl ester carboxylesterase
MKDEEMPMTKPRMYRLVTLGLCFTLLGGCSHVSGYLDFWGKQHDLKTAFKEEPSGALLRELNPGDCYLLLGRVAVGEKQNRPVLLVAVSDKFQQREIVAERILQAPVEFYQAYLPEGSYDLYFFSDLDGNGFFDGAEMVGRTSGSPIAVSKSVVRDGLTVSGPDVTLDLQHSTASPVPVRVAVKEQSYIYASLKDEFFDKKYGPVGLYDPKSLMAHTQRYLFSLEQFDPRKTLVIFVHGVGGTPQDFDYLVDSLDRTRYQPWFFFYPSGMPLQKLGSLLADLLKYANQSVAFPLRRVIVVAHSMGGLVALSALEQLGADGVPPFLKGFVSFNSPYGGVASAQSSLDHAPAVVPAWRDVVPGSAFLERLYQGRTREQIPFHLFFGYTPDDSGDGTISLQSQLAPQVHLDASKSYGFKATHVSMLNDESVRQTFYKTLAALDR